MSSTIETEAAREVAVELPAATEEKFRDIDHKIAEVADEETDRQAHLGIDQVLTPEEIDKERKFLRKIDWHIVPLLMITYGVQYSDKISLSSGVAFDLTANAGLVGNDFAWLSTGFYLAYMIFEFPFAWILHRLPLDRVLAYTVIGWGICVMCMAACNNFEQLMAVRTLLGILEAPVTPGFLVIVTAWYRREEQALRSLSFFAMNSFFSFFILLINYGVGKAAVGSSIASWRAINLFLGALSLVWGIILWWTLSTPVNARWLTPEERIYAHARLVKNNTGETAAGTEFKWAQALECFVDPQIYLLMIFTLFSSCASGGFSTFSTLILKSFGLNTEQTITYQLPWYAFQFVGTCCVGFAVNKWPHKNMKLFIAFGLMLPAIIGIFLEGLLGNDKRWGRLVGFWITGTYTPAGFILWSTTGLNVGGRTKKQVAQGLVFFAWCLGFVIGPQAFQASTAPNYRPGLIFCCCCFVVNEIILVTWYIWVRRENAQRDKRARDMGITAEQIAIEGALFGLQDMTDRQNPHFRYSY